MHTSNRPLTTRQSHILAVVMLSMDVHRCVPSIRRLCAMVGKSSTDTVYRSLLILLDKGYLTRPVVRRGLFVPTLKADFWWAERKKMGGDLPGGSTGQDERQETMGLSPDASSRTPHSPLPGRIDEERDEIWRADRASVGDEVGK